jgi:hypothetical protein
VKFFFTNGTLSEQVGVELFIFYIEACTERVIAVVTPWVFILEVPGSNLSWFISYPFSSVSSVDFRDKT